MSWLLLYFVHFVDSHAHYVLDLVYLHHLVVVIFALGLVVEFIVDGGEDEGTGTLVVDGR